MNRELRRAQAKQEKKAELEKQRKKDARRERINTLKERRAKRRERAKQVQSAGSAGSKKADSGPRKSVAELTPEERKSLPGRFSGAFMIATVFFLVLSGVAPDPEAGVVGSLTGAGFLMLFGYFSALNLERRGVANSLTFTLISGVALAGGVTAARWLSPATEPDWLMVGLGLVGLAIGAYLGRMVFYAGRR